MGFVHGYIVDETTITPRDLLEPTRLLFGAFFVVLAVSFLLKEKPTPAFDRTEILMCAFSLILIVSVLVKARRLAFGLHVAADAFIVEHGGTPGLLTSAADMGMGASDDNVDALELLPCDDAEDCARAHGIRKSTIPTVSNWGLAVLALLVLVAGGILLKRRPLGPIRVTR